MEQNVATSPLKRNRWATTATTALYTYMPYHGSPSIPPGVHRCSNLDYGTTQQKESLSVCFCCIERGDLANQRWNNLSRREHFENRLTYSDPGTHPIFVTAYRNRKRFEKSALGVARGIRLRMVLLSCGFSCAPRQTATRFHKVVLKVLSLVAVVEMFRWILVKKRRGRRGCVRRQELLYSVEWNQYDKSNKMADGGQHEPIVSG